MLHSWRIKHRLLALALVPAVAVGTALTVYWSIIKVQEIESRLETRGNTIAGFLAPAMEYGVISGNRAYLRAASHRAREEPDLVSVRVADDQGNLLYTYVQDRRPDSRLHDLSGLLFGHGVRAFEAPITLTRLVDYEAMGASPAVPAPGPDRVIGHVTVTLSTVPTAIAQTEWILRSLLIVAVLLAATAFMVRLASRPLSRPLEEMADVVNRIGRGELDVQADSRAGGELGRLAEGINGMARNIRRSHVRMTERIQASTRDIQEQLKLVDEKNRALSMARTQADEANLKKSRLLASISHELRTPLSAIQGYTELLSQHGNLDAQQQSWLNIINNSSRDTLKLVNDLLDVSRLESGRINIRKTRFDLGQCLSEVIGICRRTRRGHSVDVTLLIDPDVPAIITSDKLRFKQVITNILSNAIRYTLDGRVHMHTRLRRSGERRQLEIGVRDFGPGIDPRDLPHIFEPFFQSSQPGAVAQGGTGLGLSITRGIVNLLGGQVHVESTQGTGSVFTVSLPVSDADVPLPTPPLPVSVSDVAVWCDDPEMRRAIVRTLEVLRLSPHACHDLADYLKYLGTRAHALGIVWVREMTAGEAATLKAHPPELARTLLARGIGIGERLVHDLAAQGAHPIPLTLSVASIHRAVHELTRPASPAGAQKRRPGTKDSGNRLEGLSFLVADDNAVNRRLLTEFVQRHGGLVTQATDGFAAVSAYREKRPDLVLMDVHMPGKDGIGALEDIRAFDDAARIVAVTADLRPETHIALLQTGFDHVLYKPVSESDLLECVEGPPEGAPQSRRRAPVEFDSTQPIHDEDIALQRAGGNPRLARDMLQMLVSDVERVQAQISESPVQGEALLEMVHRIHGGARYCGTLRLAACSQALEMALKGGQTERAGNLQGAWLAEMDALLEQADDLLESLYSSTTGTD
ncbi:hybrid sensor histidine kinase/response regulator [Thioalkalivibrio denitrificans]|uniref:histidine kinase n=2 Tax=Thioalkalivibrio denitrificans TaxID=108003 RepID=A0A1V3NQC5_9GAMM|nr:hybrid sensor histidine kinase/response regulator [Thioalkalivibrio denitrificans]